MADAFYYQDAENTVQGPFTPPELKQLANEGVIVETTLVRKGEEGPWYQAGQIPGLIAAAAKPAESEPSYPSASPPGEPLGLAGGPGAPGQFRSPANMIVDTIKASLTLWKALVLAGAALLIWKACR